MDIVEKNPDTTLPGRERQIALLTKLLTGVSQILVSPGLHLMYHLLGQGKLPPCLFLHGTSSTGKTLIVSTVLSRLEVMHLK